MEYITAQEVADKWGLTAGMYRYFALKAELKVLNKWQTSGLFQKMLRNPLVEEKASEFCFYKGKSARQRNKVKNKELI